MDVNNRAAQWLLKNANLSPNLIHQALLKSLQAKESLGDFLLSHSLISKDDHRRLNEALATEKHENHSKQAFLQGFEGIERYTVLEEIGSGGMGRVFRARVLETGVLVVIKTLLSMKSSGHQIKRFHREGMALARLSHPHIARVYDFRLSESQSDEQCYPYLVMEHIEGQTLGDFFESRPSKEASWPREDQLQELFIPLAEALIHCHENGVIHRDVKPENVLIETAREKSKPRPVLVDFGLVRIDKETLRDSLELSQQLTQSGQMIGSPAFAAPEQIHGDLGKFSPAIDVWGLGATLYWAVSGELPYDVQSLLELFSATDNRNPRALRSIDSSIPHWLDSLCAQCLQRDPHKRPQMEQVLERLRTKSQPRSMKSPQFLAAITLFLVTAVALVIFFARDTTPPKLTLTPETKSSRHSYFKLTGRILDDHPRLLWIKKKHASQPKSYPLYPSGKFEATLSLNEGTNEYLVWGEDKSGLKSPVQSISILKDTMAPKLEALKYAKSSFEESVLVSGQINEAATIKVGPITLEASQASFQCSLPLKLGTNELKVSVTDQCGNQTTKDITIYRREAYHVVPRGQEPNRANCFEGFADAIKKIPPLSRLYLYPGTYAGDIDIDKTLEVIGVGNHARIIISSSGRPLRLTAAKIRLQNLYLEATGSRGNGTVLSVENNDCIIEQCILRSEFSRGMAVGRYQDTLNTSARKVIVKGTKIIDCQFTNCRAYGLVVHSQSRAFVSNCTFTGNGGGANINGESLARFEACLFTKNLRGIQASYGSMVEMTQSIFRANTGTALNFTNKAKGSISNTKITGSKRDRKFSYPNIKSRDKAHITMTNCVTQNGCGAGAHAEDGGKIDLVNCQILNNQEAGVRALKKGNITLKNCRFLGNKTPKQSGRAGKIYEN